MIIDNRRGVITAISRKAGAAILLIGCILLPMLAATRIIYTDEPEAQTTFTNVAKEAGVDAFFQSVAPVWGDYDNDGDLDLYVTGGDHENEVMVSDVFYRNNGDGTFTDITAEAGLGKSKGDSRYAGFLDYDNDGYLDLFVSNPIWEANFANFKGQVLLYHNKGDGTFAEVSEDAEVENLDGFSYAGGFADYNNDGFLDMYLTVAWWYNVLYQNKGDGTFDNVAKKAGVENVVGGQGDCGFNFTSGDYDDDGDMDIYLPGGGGLDLGPAVLYRNNGDGTFTDVAEKAGITDKSNGRGSAFFDYNNDGELDIITVGGTSPLHLYRNNGDGTFTDIAREAKLLTASYERLIVGDYDNDGYMDVYLLKWRGPKTLYRNNGDGTFTDVTQEARVGGLATRSGGCAFGDYDNDGDLDLFASNLGGFNELFRNEGNDNNWLHIKLAGTKSNRDGVGARVTVKAGDLSMTREINPGCSRGYNPLIAYFGLGQNAKADSVEIRWPSGPVLKEGEGVIPGQVDVLHNIPANQFIVVREGIGIVGTIQGKAKAVEPQGKVSITWGKVKSSKLYQNYPNPFNPETWIPFRLAKASDVMIRIYHLSGQLVRTLHLGYKEAGTYLERSRAGYWDGKNEAGEPVASGICFYRLEAGSFSQTRKMTVLR